MEKCLARMFNAAEDERKIPDQWRKMRIRTINKTSKGSTLKETQRGLFITNIVSKIYEKVKKLQNEEIINSISEMQMAGKKHHSVIHNIILVSAIIAENKKNRRPTYMFFADAEKCFDKLWLKDCIVELAELGVPPIDLEMLYQMNKEAIVQINTPVGDIDNITIEELVRQGTVYGPIFCCASTAKVNDMGEKVVATIGNIEIAMPCLYIWMI